MRTRHVLLGTLVIALASSGATSFAATKCKPHIVDDKGDGYATAGGAVLRSPAADITGGNVASGRKTVVAQLNVASTSFANDNVARMGIELSLIFVIQGATYTFERRISGFAAPAARDTFSGPGGTVTLTDKQVKVTPTSITWTVPRSLFPGLKKPKQAFTALEASSDIYIFGADAAPSARGVKYIDQTASCIKAS